MARGCLDAVLCSEHKPWDVAAGAIIITEAGGKVSCADGSLYNPQIGDLAASCNELIHQDFIRIIREADENPLDIS